ncbi:SDR family NAD(P)-dependent oxidoreductase [Neolewinella persica]|uniref:SDR family NAD(P)-dependent oxidoreductase n=1 Tax=Neolewinella persica TaxID=70998 RepID=UPI00039BFCD8|nr:SDR family NAD(P)-dependent oxidoreductase [Neolewinella persica]
MNDREYVLITGVSSGIGYDAVRFLITNNYHVFGSVRKTEDVQRLTNDFPEHFTCLQFDVTKKMDVLKSYHQVKEKLGEKKMAGLVNNAGLALGGPIELMDDEKFRYQMEVNLFAVRTVTNIFLPLLKGNKKKNISGGKIIMISSISGVLNTPFNGAYCISKHAMESLAEIYRRELMMYDVDVVSIQPGPIESNLWVKNIDQYPEYNGTDYEGLLHKSNKIMKAAKRNALPAEVISKLIFKILTKKTKHYFIVNRNWLSTVLLIKFMPSRWVDRFFYKQLFD